MTDCTLRYTFEAEGFFRWNQDFLKKKQEEEVAQLFCETMATMSLVLNRDFVADVKSVWVPITRDGQVNAVNKADVILTFKDASTAMQFKLTHR